MTKQELVMELRRIYWVEVEEREQQDEFGAMANYILDNFVAKSDVERDYVYMGGTHNPCAKQEPQTKERDHMATHTHVIPTDHLHECPVCRKPLFSIKTQAWSDVPGMFTSSSSLFVCGNEDCSFYGLVRVMG